MVRQILFIITLVTAVLIFSFTISRLIGYFRLTRPAFPIGSIGKRLALTLKVAGGQSKIFRRPFTGFFHALVFWGFCVILFSSIEMIIDGLSGTERSLAIFGLGYDIIIASGDLFGLLVTISVVIFLIRRLFLSISRFQGIEMKHGSHVDASISLSMILILMISLLGMNSTYYHLVDLNGQNPSGSYPVSAFLSVIYSSLPKDTVMVFYEIFWWIHILLIFLFANYLPYSKHFHVFMSVPNVFLSRLEPLGKMNTLESVTREVKLMLYPSHEIDNQVNVIPDRFGIRDVEDISWKNYFDSLSCTECGRCTSVCPANLTGKRLSPRKIIMDIRSRMKEKGPGLVKEGRDFSDQKALLRDYIFVEELWACTTCNACAAECPININHPSVILDMRRYLVMEEALAPGELKTVFNNIENNGAPWQFSNEDRLLWTRGISIKRNK